MAPTEGRYVNEDGEVLTYPPGHHEREQEAERRAINEGRPYRPEEVLPTNHALVVMGL